MGSLFRFISRLGSRGLVLGGIFLIGMMCLTVANVIARFFGNVIAGTYELTEIMHVVVIACALGYAVLEGSQVVVELLASRLSPQMQKILEGINSFFGLAFWGIIAWASIELLLKRGLNEETQLLGVPFLPFRFVWVIGLLFLSMVFLTRLIESLKRRSKK